MTNRPTPTYREYTGAAADAIERSFDNAPTKAERRAAYYAAEAAKAKARRDRDPVAFGTVVRESPLNYLRGSQSRYYVVRRDGRRHNDVIDARGLCRAVRAI